MTDNTDTTDDSFVWANSDFELADGEGVEIMNADITAIDLGQSGDLERTLDDPVINDGREFEGSCEFAIGADVTTCPHCGAANTIADPSWLFVFDTDPDCSTCGFPLEVVR